MYHLSMFFRINLIICWALKQKCVAISTFLMIEKSRHGWLAEPKPHPKLHEQHWATKWSRFKMSSLNSCSFNICKDTTQHKLYLFVTIKHSHTMRALILLLLSMFHLTSIPAGTRMRALSRQQTTTTTEDDWMMMMVMMMVVVVVVVVVVIMVMVIVMMMMVMVMMMMTCIHAW